MSRFRPDIKPPMWGPPDAVRFAIFANAERLGIDPSNIVDYYPLWERGGYTLRNAVSDVTSSINASYSWREDGVHVESNHPAGTTVVTKPSVIGSPFSIIQIAKPAVTYSRSYLGCGSDFGFHIGGYPNMRILLRFPTVAFTGKISHIPNQQIGMGMRWDGAIALDLFVDGRPDGGWIVTTPEELDTSSVCTMCHNANGIILSYLYIKQGISRHAFEHLQIEPYTLLMPVARPVYFDIGSGPTLQGNQINNSIVWSWT